ncbi:putative uncharacterized protein C7orf78 homolog [Amia ocellicauda]|uniref:putative uncharacterized protein C7orf78 homolog n=1 Tax=Amia ocellicauda TaxID=2972642 RepID=UPI0034648D9F
MNSEDLTDRMGSNLFSDSAASFRFDKKTAFSASQDLASIRSKGFAFPDTEPDHDIWTRQALDFTPKLYKSLRLPQKTKRNKPASLTPTSSSKSLSSAGVTQSIVLPEIIPRQEPPKFIATFKPPDALEAKVMFVKSGKYSSEVYRDPKPYDFRQYEDNIPDIVTAYDRDPGNLMFKSQSLRAISDRPALRDSQCKGCCERFDTHKLREPKWDPKLILPKPWPPKSASYTRHRRRRGVYSALMDRVEEKLSHFWQNGS